jgi:hypothetical protein
MAILKTFENGQWVPILVGATGDTGATGPQGPTGPTTGTFTGSVVGLDNTGLVDGTNNSINLNGTVKDDIVPAGNELYDLGSATNRFKDLYLSGNTIILGNAVISADGTAVNLPTSRVGQLTVDEVTGVSNLLPDANIRTDPSYAFITNNDPAAASDLGALRSYKDRISIGSAIVDGTVIVDRFNGQINVLFVDQFPGGANDIEFPGINLINYIAGDPQDFSSYTYDSETVTLLLLNAGDANDPTVTINFPTFTSEGGVLVFAGGVNSIALAPGENAAVTIKLVPDFSALYNGWVTISQKFEFIPPPQ